MPILVHVHECVQSLARAGAILMVDDVSSRFPKVQRVWQAFIDSRQLQQPPMLLKSPPFEIAPPQARPQV